MRFVPHIALVSGLAASGVTAFAPIARTNPRAAPTSLNGISEWRDRMYDFPGSGDDRRLGTEDGPPPKEVCILPFPYTDVLLQGETKQLRLYEDRFMKLFDHCMEHNEGVVAMGLLAESGIIQTVPLCEVEAYNRMEGFGIFVTIRVVSRATLVEINKQEPFLKAVCREIMDEIPPNAELPNLVAENIETSLITLSSMEHRLHKAEEEALEKGNEEEFSEVARRRQIAKLNDRFFNDPDENDDQDDDGDEIEDLDRRGRFRRAYKVAMATDTQGYCVSQPQSNTNLSPQELTALSWAAFCTDVLVEDDATFRIQALDCDNLFDRLKLAAHMLREKKQQIQNQMDKAGLKFRREDLDEDL